MYGELTLEQAREKARNWLELIRKGIDPAIAEEEARQAALRVQANTFTAVAEDYLQLHVIGPDPERPRQRKAAEVAREFRRLFIAVWGERPITSISPLTARATRQIRHRRRGKRATYATMCWRVGRDHPRPRDGRDTGTCLAGLKPFLVGQLSGALTV
jgi:hypothetical protein